MTFIVTEIHSPPNSNCPWIEEMLFTGQRVIVSPLAKALAAK